MIEIKFGDYDIQQMCERAIARQLSDEFNGTASPLRKKFQAALEKGIVELEPVINKAVRQSVEAALNSQAFEATLQKEMLKACADKFGGALNGMLKTAAKKAADALVIQQKAEALTAKAIEEWEKGNGRATGVK